MSYSVGQVAKLAGVTVRTLRHYDEIGLLSPADRSEAGYRRYVEDDLRRLQRVMFYRELGFALDDISDLVNDPHAQPIEHLRRQHKLLTARLERTRLLVAAVEKAMEAEKMGISLTPEERLEVFGDFEVDEYGAESRDRWGNTDAYREVARRTNGYTKKDWLALKAELAQINQDFVTALAAGYAPASATAMDVAERHRRHIIRWFYDCPVEMHRGLGDMYVTDERFAARYERVAPGLAEYMRDSIAANADRLRG